MKKLFALLAVFALTGCIGSTQPSRFYSLRALDTAPQTYKSAKLFVGIEAVKMPVYLDKPQIVTRNANQVELSISELNRWAEPLSDSMQSILAIDLGRYLPNAVVKPSSFRKEGFDYIIWVEVNKFEGSWNKKVTLDAWWSVIDKNNNIIFRSRAILSRPLQTSYDDLVIQESDLLNELAAEIAAKLAKLKP